MNNLIVALGYGNYDVDEDIMQVGIWSNYDIVNRMCYGEVLWEYTYYEYAL